MTSELIRVGEGHYTQLEAPSPEIQAAVKQVLEDMRQVTSRIEIRGCIPLRGISRQELDARILARSNDRSRHGSRRVAARGVQRDCS